MEEMFLGTWEVAMITPDGALTKRFKNCVTRGFSRAFCISLCDHCVCSRFNELEPSWNMRMVRSLSYGDTSCEWMIQIDAFRDNDGEINAYRDFYLNGTPNPIPRELSLTLNHEYLGEFWVMTTRAFMEHSGGPKALERLLYYMRHSGMSLGIRIADKFDYPELGMDAIGEIVGLVSDLHRRKPFNY